MTKKARASFGPTVILPPSDGRVGAKDGNLTLVIVGSSLEGLDAIAHDLLLGKLVLISVVVRLSVIESVLLLALGGGLVQLLAHFNNLGLLLFATVLVTIILSFLLFARLLAIKLRVVVFPGFHASEVVQTPTAGFLPFGGKVRVAQLVVQDNQTNTRERET